MSKSIRILVVDDCSTMRRIIRALLGDLGYTPYTRPVTATPRSTCSRPAEGKRDQILESAQPGVSGYIVKPFTAETLKNRMESILQRIAA
ncbi:MAG: hypothetical protein LC775_03135 [Acidobacteria bacterium]|nr:hypothetical protein [Acidobacteriota bacterium]